jgi:L-aspartate oxidase
MLRYRFAPWFGATATPVNERSDFLVIGSGIAALRAALELAEAGSVLVLTKADSAEGNTGYAQGGIAAAIGQDDSPDLHALDTIAAGDGLCNEAAVDVLVHGGPRDVADLMAWGARFDRGPDGQPALTREAAHSVRRVLHVRDATGREIGRVLWTRASAHSRIRVREHAHVIDLIVEGGRCVGVRFLSDARTAAGVEAAGGLERRGVRDTVAEARAPLTLLATGGAGQVFRETTNPPVACGDGIALAYLVGARVADLEFVQFHPTALDVPGRPRFLLSEALRGEGARLVNADEEPFMTRYDPAGDLAPRDRVSRGIVREMARTGRQVRLSLRHLPAEDVHARFPLISAACREAGLDLARDLIPVSPAAHYVMGGVETDLDGRTSLPGFFAAGEVACTGVHGANRLASNSLLEGLVFGRRAGEAMRKDYEAGGSGSWRPALSASGTVTTAPTTAEPIEPAEAEIRERMWETVGVVRTAKGLSSTAAYLDRAWAWVRESRSTTSDTARLRSIVVVARLMTDAALRREESRGAHYRQDCPARDDQRWRVRVAECLPSAQQDAGTDRPPRRHDVPVVS